MYLFIYYFSEATWPINVTHKNNTNQPEIQADISITQTDRSKYRLLHKKERQTEQEEKLLHSTQRCLTKTLLQAVLVQKALHGQLPQYLTEDCQLLTDIGRRSLRSADVLTCATIRTRTRLGDRSFSAARPYL